MAGWTHGSADFSVRDPALKGLARALSALVVTNWGWRTAEDRRGQQTYASGTCKSHVPKYDVELSDPNHSTMTYLVSERGGEDFEIGSIVSRGTVCDCEREVCLREERGVVRADKGCRFSELE